VDAGHGRVARRPSYALEGSAFIAGALVQWLRDGLGLIAKARDIEALARSVPDSGGVTIVPALTGLGAPHWRAEARGLITGLTRGTTKAQHRARRAGAIAPAERRSADRDAGRLRDLDQPPARRRGAAANDLLMQIEADQLGLQIFRPEMVESTALGRREAGRAGVGLPPVEKAARPRACACSRRRWPPANGAEMIERWAAAVAKA
jgi:glycerol kinase